MKREHTKQTGILPSGYTQLEYIESTGTQYIILPNYYPTTSAQVSGRYRLNTAITSIFQAGKDANRIMLFPTYSTRIDYCYGSGYKSLTVASGDNDVGVWYDFSIQYNSLTVNGHTYALVGAPNMTPIIPLHIFSSDFGGGVTVRPNAISRLTFIDSHAGNVDLYAAIRDHDQKPGLYDIINNAFYTNQGTGEFLYA